ncbi:MAG: histidine kinase [Comamonas sp.]|nr:histidine kinase [Comamonas sp.]
MPPANPTAPMPAISRMGDRHALVTQARLQLQGPAASHALLPAGVAPWLWRSWQRCLSQGRRPSERVEFEALSPHALHRAQEQQHALLQAARPVMAQMVGAVGAMRYFCLLTDAAGTVLEVQGPVDQRDMRALAIGRVGVDLSELCVGTSAIGAVLAEHSPVWVHQHEHFFDDLRDYSCAGAPIFGPQGQCLGMLDITGIDVPERPELLHLALRCARAIEDRLLRAQPHALLLHVNWPGGPLGQEGEGLMAFDSDGCLLGSNSIARQLVPRPAQPPGLSRSAHSQELLALPWGHLVEHARQRPDALMQLPLWSGLRLQALVQAGPQLQPSIPSGMAAAPATLPPANPSLLRTSEHLLIQQALQEAQGNVSQAAKRLGLSRATLYRRLGNKRNPSAR